MSAGRRTLLGYAPPRTPWLRDVSSWATSAALPVDVVRCVSLTEVRQRIAAGDPPLAVIVDGPACRGIGVVGFARTHQVPVIVVDTDPDAGWAGAASTSVLTPPFGVRHLLDVLESCGSTAPTGPSAAAGAPVTAPGATGAAPTSPATVAPGTVVSVTGAAGAGASTVAAALAQGLAGRPRAPRREVVLTDLCRRADQAMLHDARVLVPALPELVDAHRPTSAPPELERVTFAVPARGYRLLLGMRHPRQWVAFRADAVEHALDTLAAHPAVVVADVDAEFDGEAETGSLDIEDRHRLSRGALARSDVVVVVVDPTMKGIHHGSAIVRDVVSHGVPVHAVTPVLNRAPRRPPSLGAVWRSCLGDVLGEASERIPSPVALPRVNAEAAHRDTAAFPPALVRRVTRAVQPRLSDAAAVPATRVAAGIGGAP